MILNMAGGGGAPLNFKVVGNPKPNIPKENTIWLNTDDEITGWVFSVDEPTNPSAGMVWIPFGVSGKISLNALKKNGIMLHLTGAKQYINGSWANKTSDVYQNNTWVKLVEELLYMYKNGAIASVTGAWSGGASYATAEALGSKYSYSAGSTLVMDCRVPAQGQGHYTANLRHATSIPRDSYTKLNIHFVKLKAYRSDSGSNIPLSISVNGGASYAVNYANIDKSDFTVSLDVTGVSNINLYFQSNCWYSTGSYMNFSVDKIWLS